MKGVNCPTSWAVFQSENIDLCAFGAEASSGCEKICFFLRELQRISDIITRKFDFRGKIGGKFKKKI